MSKIITYILLLISASIYSQNSEKLVEFEKRYLVSINDTVKNQVLLEKFDYCLKYNKIDSTTLKLGKRVDYKLIKQKDSSTKFLWNMALLSLLNKQLNYASSYETMYAQQANDTSLQVQFLNFLIYKDNKSINKNFIANLVKFDSIFNNLNCFNEIRLNDTEYKKYIRYSKYLPGLGTYLMNERLKGITSFLITSATTYGVFELVKNRLYFNTIGFTLVYWLKFYQGNSLLTEDIIHRKLAQKENDFANECEVDFKEILSKYPLQFK